MGDFTLRINTLLALQPWGGTTPPAVKATKPRFGTINDDLNTVALSSDYAYTQVRWGVEGQPAQALASNSICSPGNIEGRLYAYVVADPSASPRRLQSDTVYSDAFSLNAAANNAPTVALSSPQGGKTVTVGDPVILNASPQDADGASDIAKLEFYEDGVKFAEATASPYTVQRITQAAGTHNYTSKVTDSKGATGLSNAVLVTVQAASGGGDGLLSFVDADWANAIRYPDANMLSPLASTRVSTNSPYLDLDVSCAVRDAGHADWQPIGVWVNGVYDGQTSVGSSARQVNRYTFKNAPSGQVLVDLVTCGQERPDDQDAAKGGILYSAQGAPGSQTSKVAVVRKNKRMYVRGTSLDNGIGTSNPQLYAWPRQFMAKHPEWEICVEGCGYHSASRSYGSEAQRAATAARSQGYLLGGTECYDINFLVPNDFLFGWGTAAQVSAIVGDIADKVHKLDASIRVRGSVGLPIGASKNAGYSNYQAALRGLSNSDRNTWFGLLDNLVSVNYTTSDEVHYTAEGYGLEADNIFAGLPWAPTGPVNRPVVAVGSMETALNGNDANFWEIQESAYTNLLTDTDNLLIAFEMQFADYNASFNQFIISKQLSLDTYGDRSFGLYLDGQGKRVVWEFFANSLQYATSRALADFGFVNGNAYAGTVRHSKANGIIITFSNGVSFSMQSPGGNFSVSSTPVRIGSVLTGDGSAVANAIGIIRNVSICTRYFTDAEVDAIRANHGKLTSAQLAESTTLGSWPLTRVDNSSPLSANLVTKNPLAELKAKPVASVFHAGETVQENDPRITYVGTWYSYASGSDPALIGGARKYVNGGDDSSAQWKTDATNMAFSYAGEDYSGSVDIFVNGQIFTSFNQYASATTPGRVSYVNNMPAGVKDIVFRKTTPSGSYLIILDQIAFS